MISRDLSKIPSTLFLDYSPNILAYIFRLETTQTNKALTFVAKVLSDAADRGSINIANVVKSSGLPLLAELVVGMGDEGARADTVRTSFSADVQYSHTLTWYAGCGSIEEGPPMCDTSSQRTYCHGIRSWGLPQGTYVRLNNPYQRDGAGNSPQIFNAGEEWYLA
jgi:hypothetical protein